jgi:hypothetical protein
VFCYLPSSLKSCCNSIDDAKVPSKKYKFQRARGFGKVGRGSAREGSLAPSRLFACLCARKRKTLKGFGLTRAGFESVSAKTVNFGVGSRADRATSQQQDTMRMRFSRMF